MEGEKGRKQIWGQGKGRITSSFLSKMQERGGQPGGVVVKFACSALAARGLQVWIPWVDLAPLVKPCCGGIPHKIEEDWPRR